MKKSFIIMSLFFYSCCDSYNDENYYFKATDITNNVSLDKCELSYSFCQYDRYLRCNAKTEKLTISDGEEIPCNDNNFYKKNCYEKINAKKNGYHLIKYYNYLNCKSREFPNTLSFEFRPIEDLSLKIISKKSIKYLRVDNRIKNRITDLYKSYNIDIIGEFKHEKNIPVNNIIEFNIPSVFEDSIYFELTYLFENQNPPYKKKEYVTYTNRNSDITIELD